MSLPRQSIRHVRALLAAETGDAGARFDRDALRAVKSAWGLEWELHRIAAFIKNTVCTIAIGSDQLESLFDDE